ncbi:MAG: hypothetical protein Q4D79_14900 [Propionibacteriaceae bacterium]|nr:hypothetical protein [Propionibacteriaceae bacterium]
MTDIATLIHELAPGSPIPTDEGRAWHLLRGLLNAREPGNPSMPPRTAYSAP